MTQPMKVSMELEELLRGAFVDGTWYSIMVDEQCYTGEDNAT